MHNSAETPTVSVVIPIYKVERYLAQCVESVLSQSFRDLEVVLVDDGSPDNCPQIADDFAARDPRVTVIHQENQGLSGARNSGLRCARGRLVAFLDSDDYWEGEESLAQCVAAFDERPELDVLFLDCVRLYESTGLRTPGDPLWDRDELHGVSQEKMMHYMVRIGNVRPTAWGKVIRREFLIDHHLFFKEGIYSEDFEWFLRLIEQPAIHGYIPLSSYVYRMSRLGSITQTIGRANVQDILDTVIAASRRMLASESSRGFKQDFLSYCCHLFMMALALCPRLPRTDWDSLRPGFEQGRFLLSHVGYPNCRAIALLAKVVGLDATARLLHTYLAMRARWGGGR